MQPPCRIFLAGTCTFGIAEGQPQYNKLLDIEKPIANNVAHRLESYHYVGKERKVTEMRNAGVKVFLDSGAFSAYTLGQVISIEEYCQYIHRNMDLIRVEEGVLMASVLDDIGNEQITYENQLKMESLGVKPMPTFHTNEDTRYLDFYANNYEYLSLGGMVGAGPAQLQLWLDRMWNNHLLDGAGRPKTRVHGFGITSIPLMERYPWYSCDSSSWIQTTSFGGITIPGYGNLNVSIESPSRHDAGQHLRSLTDIEQEQVRIILERQGFDLKLVEERYLGRATYNIWAYQEMERQLNAKKATMPDRAPMPMELF